MMKFTVLAAALLVAFCAMLVDARRPKWHELTPKYSYEQYLKDLRKTRPSSADEYGKRKQLFEAELARVLQHNTQQPEPNWRKGVNKFSDWTESDKRALRGLDFGLHQRNQAAGYAKPERMHLRDNRPLPPSKDWRLAVPPILTTVKDQGQCGSCYAHAATQTIETAWAQATGDLFVLSQQQVASCTYNPDDCGGSGGCEGGIAELCITSVAARGGIVENWAQPYLIYNGTDVSCSDLTLWKNLTKVKVTGYTAIQHNSVDAALHALAFTGPIAIGADASQWSNYESGVFDMCTFVTNTTSIDHAIMAVGYGSTLGGVKYIIVRNSWGSEYGEDGFIKLAVYPPEGPRCGWNVNPQQGNGCKGQTAPQVACGCNAWAFDTLYANADFTR